MNEEASPSLSTKKRKKNEDNNLESSFHEVYKELENILKNNKNGSTCIGGSCKNVLPPIPGLEIEGVGLIPYPITEKFASKMKKNILLQAPCHDTETTVDPPVCNTLQVDAANLIFLNPAWLPGLQQLIQKAAEGLGVVGNMVQAKLCKLLLHEPGSFFKENHGTEKVAGMFGTLEVQLPSIFKGASTTVSHRGESQSFEFDVEESAFECQYVAHYADCEHEMKPTESGYRLALIYSLCYKGSDISRPCANNLAFPKRLGDQIRYLPAEKSCFCLPLKHYCEFSSLEKFEVCSFLKGDDKKLFQAISDAVQHDDDWEVIIMNLSRVDIEWGDYGVHGGWFAHGCNEGELNIDEIYTGDGSEADHHKNWILQQLELKPFGENGMVLLKSKDDMKSFWGDGDEGEVEGPEREVTYFKTVVMVFRRVVTRW